MKVSQSSPLKKKKSYLKKSITFESDKTKDELNDNIEEDKEEYYKSKLAETIQK